MKIDVKKGLQKTGEVVGKAAGGVKTTAVDLAGKIKDESAKAKFKKLNPLFPEEYRSEEFHIPNLIVVVDDAVRRNEELCRGAIGWRENVKDVEVLYLYDEFVPECGLRFIPNAVCDCAYYVDPHDRSSFIQIDSLFDRTQQSKLAELADIAYCLGAKRYSVEMVESNKKETTAKSDASISAGIAKLKIGASEKSKRSESNESNSKSLAYVEFMESRVPVEPKLLWFRNDDYIKSLIRQICDGNGTVKQVNIELSGSDYATMSGSTSVKVNAAVCKIGLNTTANIEQSSAEERTHKMIFHLEF